jgi:hypothetical protein
MSVNTQVITGTIVHGQPSGNYDGSSLLFNTDAARAVSYYLGQGSLQIVTISVLGFQGHIVIQGTLSEDPNNAAWADIYDFGLDGSTELSQVSSTDVPGNFTWMRAQIRDFEAGTVTYIRINY